MRTSRQLQRIVRFCAHLLPSGERAVMSVWAEIGSQVSGTAQSRLLVACCCVFHAMPVTDSMASRSRIPRDAGCRFCQVAEGRASVTGTKHVSSISRHKSPHPRYRMPWREGHDSLLPAIDDAPVETDCGAGYEHSRIVAHVHQNERRAFGVLALGYVRVTLQHDCSRIDPGRVAQMA